jgi:hypothetical protein
VAAPVNPPGRGPVPSSPGQPPRQSPGPAPGSSGQAADKFRLNTIFGVVANVSAVFALLKDSLITIALVLCIAAIVSSIDAFVRKQRRRWAVSIIVVAVLTLAVALLGGPSRVGGILHGTFASPSVSQVPSPSPAAPPASAAPKAVGMTGGCANFRIYAQNRWAPLGATIRSAPTASAKPLGTVAPNYQLFTNGYIHTEVAYPLNPPPWNNDVWFHVADGGWVSFAGVRAVPTTPDPTGLADGGTPVPLVEGCLGALQ